MSIIFLISFLLVEFSVPRRYLISWIDFIYSFVFLMFISLPRRLHWTIQNQLTQWCFVRKKNRKRNYSKSQKINEMFEKRNFYNSMKSSKLGSINKKNERDFSRTYLMFNFSWAQFSEKFTDLNIRCAISRSKSTIHWSFVMFKVSLKS